MPPKARVMGWTIFTDVFTHISDLAYILAFNLKLQALKHRDSFGKEKFKK